jgi:hypothetical protein
MKYQHEYLTTKISTSKNFLAGIKERMRQPLQIDKRYRKERGEVGCRGVP